MSEYYKQIKQTHYMKILVISVVFIIAITLGSIISVFANTVQCTVIDDGESYTFNLTSPDTNEIIAEAVAKGMPSLSVKDVVVNESGTLHVKRAIDISMVTTDTTENVIAYKGDTVQQVLDINEIVYNETSKIEPALDFVLIADQTVVVEQLNKVTLVDEYTTKNFTMYSGTVADALALANIKLDENDTVVPTVDAMITSKTNIEIKRGKNITLFVDGEEMKISTYSKNVSQLLKELDITLSSEDVLDCKNTDKLVDDMIINLSRVVYLDKEEVQVIKYMTEYISDPDMESGESYVKTKGENGEKTLYYKEKYVNGELVTTTFIKESKTKEPINKVVVKGTKNASNTFVDASGKTVSYSNVMVGECTAYCDPGGITSLGWDTQVGVVAVNPAVIPYGTKMYITSGSVVYGYAVAGDTGGAALSNRILVDLYYNTDQEAWDFGRRDMTVYILD